MGYTWKHSQLFFLDFLDFRFLYFQEGTIKTWLRKIQYVAGFAKQFFLNSILLLNNQTRKHNERASFTCFVRIYFQTWNYSRFVNKTPGFGLTFRQLCQNMPNICQICIRFINNNGFLNACFNYRPDNNNVTDPVRYSFGWNTLCYLRAQP